METSPLHDVMLARDVEMRARDGARLATDVWRPAAAAEAISDRFPAIVMRTPYDRTHPRYERQGEFWAARGFLYVVQDCRGRFASDGDFVLLADEGPDGHDAVEWAAALPFCDGAVGTLGTSYSAWTQNALAIERPPHLRAMWINQGGENGCRSSLRHNGTMELRWLTWAVTHGAASIADTDPAGAEELRSHAEHMRDWLVALPWTDTTPLAALPGYDAWARALYEHADEDDPDGYWLQTGLNFAAHVERSADVPTMYSGGWYDSYTRATTDNYVSFAAAKQDQYLLMGPWTHGDAPLDRSYAGEVEFGQAASMSSNAEEFPGGSRLGEQLRWFDRWLRDAPVERETSPVRIFVMGGGSGRIDSAGRLEHGGSWRNEEHWPLARAVPTAMHLHPRGGLDAGFPTTDEGSSTIVYDPTKPLPTISANTSSLNEVVPTPARVVTDSPIALMRVMVIQGAADQRLREDTPGSDGAGPLAARDDVLIFESEPLTTELEVTGPIEAVIHLSTNVADTDVFVMVQDVYPESVHTPDGFRLNIADGIMRVRYRDGFDRGRLLTDNTPVEVRFQLYPTSNRFAPGHRLAVLISSSSFPRFDPNPNTGEPVGRHTHTRVATTHVHHSTRFPSRLILPVVAGQTSVQHQGVP